MISDDVMLIQALVVAILGIFEAYLALGLIVGIGGIGVVTVRSVSESEKQSAYCVRLVIGNQWSCSHF